jgi:hypothetical protein
MGWVVTVATFAHRDGVDWWSVVVGLLIVVFGFAGLVWYAHEATAQEDWRAYWTRRDREERRRQEP